MRERGGENAQEIVEAFRDRWRGRGAHPNEGILIRRTLRCSASASEFASLHNHHPVVIRGVEAVEAAGRADVYATVRDQLSTAGLGWASAAEATGRAAIAAIADGLISDKDREALTVPWREALVECPRDLRPELAAEFADEEAAVRNAQRVIDSFFFQLRAAKARKGEAKLILAALRRFPRIMSSHPAYERSWRAAGTPHLFYGASVGDLSPLADRIAALANDGHFADEAGRRHDPGAGSREQAAVDALVASGRTGLIRDEVDRDDLLGHVKAMLGWPSGIWTAAGRAARNAAQAVLVADRISGEDFETLTRPWREVLSEGVGHDERMTLLSIPEHPDWAPYRSSG